MFWMVTSMFNGVKSQIEEQLIFMQEIRLRLRPPLFQWPFPWTGATRDLGGTKRSQKMWVRTI
jgi:hypothetical protein